MVCFVGKQESVDATLAALEVVGEPLKSMAYMLVDVCAYAGIILHQSELPRSIPRNSVESDHGCTSRVYFDNPGDNMTLTLYNVTLTSRKPCFHNNKCDCSKTNGLNGVYVFFN